MHIGIDLGRTKIAYCLLDTSGQAIVDDQIKTPDTYDSSISAIANIALELTDKAGKPCTIGLGTPGAHSAKTGLMKNAGVFDGHPLKRDVEATFGAPIAMKNDANCFALSEAIDGAAKGANCVFGVIIGTGVGGGLVIHGKPLVGVSAIAGEWGHNPLPWPTDDERPGEACFCGKHGCMETFLSGPSLARIHAQQFGEHLTAEEIAKGTTAACESSLQQYEDRLARGLAHVINILDPDVVVLGGGLSNIDPLYENVPKRWTEFISSDHIETTLKKAVHGSSSGRRGAAWLGKAMAEDKGA